MNNETFLIDDKDGIGRCFNLSSIKSIENGVVTLNNGDVFELESSVQARGIEALFKEWCLVRDPPMHRWLISLMFPDGNGFATYHRTFSKSVENISYPEVRALLENGRYDLLGVSYLGCMTDEQFGEESEDFRSDVWYKNPNKDALYMIMGFRDGKVCFIEKGFPNQEEHLLTLMEFQQTYKPTDIKILSRE